MRRICILATCAVVALSITTWAGKGGGGGKPGGGGDPPPNPAIAFLYGHDLMVMNEDGSNVTKPVDGYVRFPSWSPDGTQLVFFGDVSGSGVYVINADGTGLEKLTSTSGTVCPRWSPAATADGNYKIAFGGESDPGIWLMNTDGSGLIRLTKEGSTGRVYVANPEYTLAWSPDARRLAVARGGRGINAGIRIHELGLDNEDQIYAVASPQYLDGWAISRIAWSKTSDDLLAFELASGPSSLPDIWILDVDGPDDSGTPEATNLTQTDDDQEILGDWSSDDSLMVFIQGSPGAAGIWTLLVADPSWREMLFKEKKWGVGEPSWRR